MMIYRSLVNWLRGRDRPLTFIFGNWRTWRLEGRGQGAARPLGALSGHGDWVFPGAYEGERPHWDGVIPAQAAPNFDTSHLWRRVDDRDKPGHEGRAVS